MSRSLGRRKSSLKIISVNREPPGPILKFKWSISAAHLAALEENSSIVLPSISTDRSSRKILPTSCSLVTDTSSFSRSSISTNKLSPFPNLTKQCKSPISTEADRNSVQHIPLSLTFAQLHHSPSSNKRRKQSRPSIFPTPDGKRDSVSFLDGKLSTMSGPTTTISLLASKTDLRLPNENFMRLNSPQLRRLNVSEKYINEAKKLYFNAECRIFTPRVSVGQVF